VRNSFHPIRSWIQWQQKNLDKFLRKWSQHRIRKSHFHLAVTFLDLYQCTTFSWKKIFDTQTPLNLFHIHPAASFRKTRNFSRCSVLHETDRNLGIFLHHLSEVHLINVMPKVINKPNNLPTEVEDRLKYFPQAKSRFKGCDLYISVLIGCRAPLPKIFVFRKLVLRKLLQVIACHDSNGCSNVGQITLILNQQH